MTNQPTAAVIGAGIGGLTSAIALAANGNSVHVFEAADGPGGKATQLTIDGMTFDTGPSLVTLPDVFDTVFRIAGTTAAEQLEWVEHAPGFRYHFADKTVVDTHVRLEDTLQSIGAALGDEAQREAADFMRYADRIWETSAPNFIFGEAPSLTTLMKQNPLRVAGVLRDIDATSSMWGAIRKRVKSPHLRAIFARYATYNGSDVRCAPATLNCIAHVELGLGGYGIRGGFYALSEALERVAKGLGVCFHYGQRVVRIAVSDGRASGLQLKNGEFFPAHAVVSNVDVTHLRDDLISDARSARSLLPESAPSMSAYCFAFEATGPNRGLPHQVFFPNGQYLAEFKDVFDNNRAPIDPTIYACNQRQAHGRDVGARGGDPLFVMVNAPPVTSEAEPSSRELNRLTATVTTRLQAAGVLADGDPLMWCRTPNDLAVQYPGSSGSIYGPSSNSQWSAFKRSGNTHSRIDNLYIASGSAHPGGGVPLCALSGLAAARSALRAQGCATSDRIQHAAPTL